MVMKKIIAFIICLALCVSGLAVGMMNQRANDAGVLNAGASAAVGAGDVVDNLVGSTGTIGAQKLPAVATENLTGGEIVKVGDDYELTGNITVSDASVFADVAAALNAGHVFNGNGYTITIANNAPLFGETLTAGTIKNFAIAGTYTTSAIMQTGLASYATVEDGVTITVENVVVDFDMTMAVADTKGAAGFFSQVTGAGTVNFNNCAFTGTIKAASNSLAVRAGGFIAFVGTNNVNFTNCTTDGTIAVPSHCGGFIADLNGSAVGTFKNCYSGIFLDQSNVKAETGGIAGFAGWMSSSAVFNAENCLSEASFVLANAKHFAGGYVGTYNAGCVSNFKNCTSNVTRYEWVSGFAQDTFFGGFIGNYTNPPAARKVTFENCANNGDMNLTIPNANIGLNWGGFVGRTEATNLNATFEFTNCVNNADVTITSASNATGRNMNIGGFFGMFRGLHVTATNCANNGNITYTQTVANSGHFAGGFIGTTHEAGCTITVNGFVNNGNITSTTYGAKNSYVGGVIGHINNAPKTFTLTNCVNTGDISFSSHKDATLDRIEAGGIIGCVANTPTSVSYLTNCINLGDVTVVNNSQEDKADNQNDYQLRAGGIAATVPGKVMIDTCINAGNVSGTVGRTSDSGENAVGLGQPVGGLFGVCASIVYRCVNLGNVSSNSDSASAIAGYFSGTTTPAGIRYCVNMGNITSSFGGSFVKFSCKAAKDPTNEEDKNYLTGATFTSYPCFNGGTIANIIETSETGGAAGEYTGDITGFITGVAALPAYCTPDVTKSVNAQAYVALIFANVDDALIEHFMTEKKLFTVDKTMDGFICNTYVNETFYDAIEAIAGDSNVYFDGIVVPVKVANAASAVTIKGITALMAEKGTDTKLYFDADRNEQNIDKTVDVPADGKYTVNIVLRYNAGEVPSLSDGYTARAYIKIGGAYIYSTPKA